MAGLSIRIRNNRFWAIIFVFWAIVLIILNVIPNYTPPSLQMEEAFTLRTDFILHFLSFLILSVLYFLSGNKTIIDKVLKTSWSLILLGILFAAFVEGVQLFIPGRAFNPLDILFNVTGFLAGIPTGKFVCSL
jgi:VanZ family protein